MQKHFGVYAIIASAVISIAIIASIQTTFNADETVLETNEDPAVSWANYWNEKDSKIIESVLSNRQIQLSEQTAETYTISDDTIDGSFHSQILTGELDAGLIPSFHGAFAALSPAMVPEEMAKGRNVIEVNLVAQSVDLPIMGHKPGEPKTYKAMTFNGQVPAPTIRATQGDIIKVTLTVPEGEPVPHSVDHHASQISAIPNFGAVLPGESMTYYFIAEHHGVFKYHCEGVNVADMDRHSLSGMNGMVIVDPIDGYKKLMTTHTVMKNGKATEERKFYSPDALEFALVFDELYLDEKGQFDREAEFSQHPTQTLINGMAFGYTPSATHNEAVTGDPQKNLFVAQPWNSPELKQYQGQVLSVPTNEHIRFFLENNGNEPIYFHIVGEQLDRVVSGNRVQEANTQTFMLGGSDDAIVDVVFEKPGVYVPVNHDYASLFQGQAAVIVAGDPFDLNKKMGTNAKSYAELLGNPSDAVPPMGKNSIAHPKINLHGLYTDDRAAEIAKMLGI